MTWCTYLDSATSCPVLNDSLPEVITPEFVRAVVHPLSPASPLNSSGLPFLCANFQDIRSNFLCRMFTGIASEFSLQKLKKVAQVGLQLSGWDLPSLLH